MRFHHFLRVFIFVDYFYYSIVYSCNHTIKKRQFFFSCTRLTRNEHSAYVQSGYTTIEHFPWTSQISPNCCYFFWVCCVRRLILLRDAACHPRNSVECRTQICSIHHESSYSLREMIHCGTNSILCRYRCSGFCCVFMPFFFSNYYSNHRKEAEKKTDSSEICISGTRTRTTTNKKSSRYKVLHAMDSIRNKEDKQE